MKTTKQTGHKLANTWVEKPQWLCENYRIWVQNHHRTQCRLGVRLKQETRCGGARAPNLREMEVDGSMKRRVNEMMHSIYVCTCDHDSVGLHKETTKILPSPDWWPHHWMSPHMIMHIMVRIHYSDIECILETYNLIWTILHTCLPHKLKEMVRKDQDHTPHSDVH